MTTRKPNPIALAIVRRVLSYAPHQPPCSPTNDEWHCDGCQLIVECADDNFDDLLPDPERPVLSDMALEVLYHFAMACGPLVPYGDTVSSALSHLGHPQHIVAELRAWERWRESKEGE